MLFFLAGLFKVNSLPAQYAAINYDLAKNYFNEGQPLPAEKPLMMSGELPRDISRIEISILPAKAKDEDDELYRAVWKAIPNTGAERYNLAVNYPLRPSEQYDFAFTFFREMERSEKQELQDRLFTQVNALARSHSLNNGQLADNPKRPKKIVAELNDLMCALLENYRSADELGFAGFSEAVKQSLRTLQNLQPAAGKDGNPSKIADAQSVAEAYDKIGELLRDEIRQLMEKDWSMQQNARYVDNYQTEEKQTYFSINAGYGGVYLSGKLENISYGDSPYLGLSFPLGSSTLAPKFLRNTSLTLGAFLQNFEDVDGHEVTGFIVNRPLYLGLDFKLFQFIRFNAGAALLETNETTVENGVEKNSNTVFVRPFVGLSAKVDLSLGLGK